MRIGELSMRTGVNPATLRAWERRYGVLRPRRTAGGHRTYDDQDLARARAVAALVDGGLQASEAVRRLSTPRPDTTAAAEDAGLRLWRAFDAFDERAAKAVLSEATDALGVPALLDAVLVPAMRQLGAEWRQSPRNIAREHFASVIVRAHLVQLLPVSRPAKADSLAFCPEGELHDIGLVMAALTLADAGRSPVVLGAHTPSASVDLLLDELRPSVVLIAAETRRPVLRLIETWRPRAGCLTVAGGGGFRPEDGPKLQARVHLEPYALLPSALREERP